MCVFLSQVISDISLIHYNPKLITPSRWQNCPSTAMAVNAVTVLAAAVWRRRSNCRCCRFDAACCRLTLLYTRTSIYPTHSTYYTLYMQPLILTPPPQLLSFIRLLDHYCCCFPCHCLLSPPATVDSIPGLRPVTLQLHTTLSAHSLFREVFRCTQHPRWAAGSFTCPGIDTQVQGSSVLRLYPKDR